jgi:hypothetical protein
MCRARTRARTLAGLHAAHGRAVEQLERHRRGPTHEEAIGRAHTTEVAIERAATLELGEAGQVLGAAIDLATLYARITADLRWACRRGSIGRSVRPGSVCPGPGRARSRRVDHCGGATLRSAAGLSRGDRGCRVGLGGAPLGALAPGASIAEYRWTGQRWIIRSGSAPRDERERSTPSSPSSPSNHHHHLILPFAAASVAPAVSGPPDGHRSAGLGGICGLGVFGVFGIFAWRLPALAWRVGLDLDRAMLGHHALPQRLGGA